MSHAIDAILDSYHAVALQEMAQAAGLVSKSSGRSRKNDLIALMRAQFFTKERVDASLSKLSPRERAVLDRLLVRGASQPTRILARELERARLVTPASQTTAGRQSGRTYAAMPYTGDAGRIGSTIFEDVMARLALHGLVLSKYAEVVFGVPPKITLSPADVVYIPEAILRHLPEPPPLPEEGLAPTPAEVRSGDAGQLLRDLYLYWDVVRQNGVALIRTGLVGKRWLKVLNRALLQPDERVNQVSREDEAPHLHLLRLLLEALGLIKVLPSGELAPGGADRLQIPEFWTRSPAEQARACLELWPQLDVGGEADSENSRYYPAYPRARKALLGLMKSLPAGVWLDPEEVLFQLQIQDANFLFPDRARLNAHSGQRYYSSYHYSGRPENLQVVLDEGERRFIAGCLTGFLFQIGWVDLGYSSDGKWVAVRVKELQLDQPQGGKLIVQPNFQLLAMGPVGLATLARLDLFADRERVDRTVFEYRLSRESLYRAQQLGMDVSDVIELLTAASDLPLPQNVRRSLEEWQSQQERIVFRSGVTLLQAEDAALLDDLMNDPQTGPSLARAVAPAVVLVRSDGVQSLVAALLGRGLLPAQSGASAESADDGVIIGADGAIRPVHAVPSLHLRGRLERLAEERPGGTWQLTPNSVRRAGGSKERVRSVLQELERLCRGPLPAGLPQQIRAWGGYYGHAAIEQQVVLIEFRDRETLQELCADPAFEGLLSPFAAGERALAVVPAGRVQQVRNLLKQYGVDLREGIKRK